MNQPARNLYRAGGKKVQSARLESKTFFKKRKKKKKERKLTQNEEIFFFPHLETALSIIILNPQAYCENLFK